VLPAAADRRGTLALGIRGSFGVGQEQISVTEPGHIGVTGQHLGARALRVEVMYPLSSGPGSLPLLLFAPGFMQCGGPYGDLLRGWASAGYVVAAVDFPRTDCRAGAAVDEADLVNQPADMSYVLTRLLAARAAPYGLIDPRQVAAAGQSDGGDTVAALAADTCCRDPRLAATAVLSGAEWAPMPGRYFPHRAPPMLFVQGSADTVNPPWASVQLYQTAPGRARYYLDLLGAGHTTPYWGSNPVEQVVGRLTLAFFDRYVLGQPRALAVPASAVLTSGGRLP